ncbi:unnamed protein product [Trichogramma brassicae]|uniref:Uncharacterized protein n=1 Tax=Trichogramma brassicae TaxID=86971 RepID=A0A6H5IFX8_9HYME|nr:unnamed protein product [Trichogramma brassicae]
MHLFKLKKKHRTPSGRNDQFFKIKKKILPTHHVPKTLFFLAQLKNACGPQRNLLQSRCGRLLEPLLTLPTSVTALSAENRCLDPPCVSRVVHGTAHRPAFDRRTGRRLTTAPRARIPSDQSGFPTVPESVDRLDASARRKRHYFDECRPIMHASLISPCLHRQSTSSGQYSGLATALLPKKASPDETFFPPTQA